MTVKIAHDGFVGDVIGHYTTREGKRGYVLQQIGTRVVHVYGAKWVEAQDIASGLDAERDGKGQQENPVADGGAEACATPTFYVDTVEQAFDLLRARGVKPEKELDHDWHVIEAEIQSLFSTRMKTKPDE